MAALPLAEPMDLSKNMPAPPSAESQALNASHRLSSTPKAPSAGLPCLPPLPPPVNEAPLPPPPLVTTAAQPPLPSCAGVSARWRYASCRAAFSRALLFSMFAVATSILPHMFSTRSRRVSNAPLFVGAAASVRLSRAPHFRGGDEHPAALGQAVFFQQ